MVASASATPQANSSAWQVILNFKSNGAKAFGDLTTTMYGKYGTSNSPLDDLAVVLDGTVVSFPAINQGPITGGQAQITGNFNQQTATTLGEPAVLRCAAAVVPAAVGPVGVAGAGPGPAGGRRSPAPWA